MSDRQLQQPEGHATATKKNAQSAPSLFQWVSYAVRPCNCIRYRQAMYADAKVKSCPRTVSSNSRLSRPATDQVTPEPHAEEDTTGICYVVSPSQSVVCHLVKVGWDLPAVHVAGTLVSFNGFADTVFLTRRCETGWRRLSGSHGEPNLKQNGFDGRYRRPSGAIHLSV